MPELTDQLKRSVEKRIEQIIQHIPHMQETVNQIIDERITEEFDFKAKHQHEAKNSINIKIEWQD